MRRIVFRPMIAIALASTAWVVSTASSCLDLAVWLITRLLEVVIWTFDFMPRLAAVEKPARRIWMAATAMNGRQVGGVRVPGYLGRPAVMSLTG